MHVRFCAGAGPTARWSRVAIATSTDGQAEVAIDGRVVRGITQFNLSVQSAGGAPVSATVTLTLLVPLGFLTQTELPPVGS